MQKEELKLELDEIIQTQDRSNDPEAVAEKELDKMRRVQKKRRKGNYGKLAIFAWLAFIGFHLYKGDLILYSAKDLLMFIPGLLIAALIGVGIFYFILFRGFEKIARRLNFSSLAIFTVGMFVEIINIVTNWFAANWYFYLLNIYF